MGKDLCIGMMFQNEADWLRLHLPVLMQSGAGLVGLDGGSQDEGAEVIREFGGICYENPYRWPSVHQHNKLIECCEDAGYDAMVKTDPDELWFPDQIAQMWELLQIFKLLRFPTYHFVDDRLHYCPEGWYPDWHGRAWRLHLGVRYIHDFHSIPNWVQLGWQMNESNRLREDRDVVHCGHIHLFHYGELKDRYTRALRGRNVALARQGQPLLDKLPDGIELIPRFSIPFVGPQPLNPAECGPRAPIEYEGVPNYA